MIQSGGNKEPQKNIFGGEREMWDLLNQFIPTVATTLINLAELAIIGLIGYGFVKFIVWAGKKLTCETPKAK